MNFLEKLASECKKNLRTIIFPEGKDAKILEAAYRLKKEGLLAKSIVMGDKSEIEAAAKICGADLSFVEIIEPLKDKDYDKYCAEYFELRKHKNITMDFAKEQMKKTHFFGAMAVRMDRADGMVSGINSETKPFIPSFEIIKTAKGISRVSSLFFEVFPDKVLFYSDCGVNIDPDEDTLAEIAITTAITAKQFWHEPRVAMLSFSTRDSAKHPFVDKMKNATAKAKQKARDMGLSAVIDGELQFDAAFIPEVALKKAPDSPFTKERANVFIFPDLNAGNICYKVTERLAGAQAFGPIMQGLNKPVNDLSRGAKVTDIMNAALITVIQSL
ncbi:MAG TPA: phosphate acetyltransferase [Spirochaetota bacterium]|jgi:phosphate acetyltransferase|nr:MAG: Phosphate acetyltransferase [Spirochaetes bacterium ADurb.Bin133]HNZ28170.1 phosphate acetyltransferase [Spirochaetota bacterium]HPY88543.1 phosphate acetyltransferase [Spirochaetota bacterium]HQB60900.1 phosphate acetyltransferase [Spirochaetota bacterium]